MRRTLTLEADVDAAITNFTRKSGLTFKEVVNTLLRRGLQAHDTPKPLTPLRIEPLKLGLKPGLSLVSVSQLESLVEEDAV